MPACEGGRSNDSPKVGRLPRHSRIVLGGVAVTVAADVGFILVSMFPAKTFNELASKADVDLIDLRPAHLAVLVGVIDGFLGVIVNGRNREDVEADDN